MDNFFHRNVYQIICEVRIEQDRVYTEILDVVGGPEVLLTGEHLKDLRYMEMCIKETLRLFPSVPIMGRKVTNDIVIGESKSRLHNR